jgi:hypothetical protein
MQMYGFYTEFYSLSTDLVMYQRDIYTFMDVLGDLGGVTEIFMVVLGTLFGSWAEH